MYGGFGGPGGPGGHGPGGPGGHGPGGPGHGGYHGGPGYGGYGPGPGRGFGGPGFGGPGFRGGGFYGFFGGTVGGASAVRNDTNANNGRPVAPATGGARTRAPRPAETETPASRAAMYLAGLTLLMGAMLLLANFLGAKIWHVGFVIQDGGVLVFPIIYVCGDLLVEIFGKNTANRAAVMVCGVNAITIIACIIVNALPELPGSHSDILTIAYGLSTRIMLASIFGFLLSQLFNNWLFQKIRERTQYEEFWKRSLGSSIGAHIIDSVIFNLFAFYGRTTVEQFMTQLICAIVVGFALEAALNPLAKRIANKIYEHIYKASPASPTPPVDPDDDWD